MPKRILDEDEDSQFDENEELDEEEMQDEAEEQFVQPVSKRNLARNNLPPLPPLPPAKPRPVLPPIRRAVQPPEPPKKRYQGFVQQSAEGIIDVETQEVIATDIWTALANIIERLERIENSVGSMLNG